MPRVLPGQLPQIDPAFYRLTPVLAVLGVWSFFIHLKCLGEVHRFSAWRAFGAVLIPVLIVIVGLGLAVFLFALIVGGHH